MSSIDLLSSPQSATQPTSVSDAARSSFDDDFEFFLTLLTSQIQNQDPLEPLDTNEMTQQITSFSSLEQQINTNEELEKINSSLASMTVGNAVSYLGDTVTYSSSKTTLSNGEANWRYTVSGGTADKVDVTVRDSAGNIVKTETLDGPLSGEQEYRWNGRTDSGNSSPEGDYSITFRAETSDGGILNVNTAGSGVVEEVDLSGTNPRLKINGGYIDLDEVISVAPTRT